MCWYCCISLRGAVYFGTSVHIFVGLGLLLKWIVRVYLDGVDSDKLLVDASVLITTVLSGMYNVFFIALGCLIFAGVERESVSVLKWAAAGFSTLQMLAYTLILILYLVAPTGWSPLDAELSPEMRLLTISMFYLSSIATINYLIVLFLYIRKLWNRKKRSITVTTSGSRRTISSTHKKSPSTFSTQPRISHPMLLQPTTPTHTVTSSSLLPLSQVDSAHRRQTPAHSHGSGGSYAVSYHRRLLDQGPESPGIYESLDNHSSGASLRNAPVQVQEPYSNPNVFNSTFNKNYNYNLQQQQAELIYAAGGGGSIRSNYSQRAYPYPHQRYREPLSPAQEQAKQEEEYNQRLLRDQAAAVGQHHPNWSSSSVRGGTPSVHQPSTTVTEYPRRGQRSQQGQEGHAFQRVVLHQRNSGAGDPLLAHGNY